MTEVLLFVSKCSSFVSFSRRRGAFNRLANYCLSRHFVSFLFFLQNPGCPYRCLQKCLFLCFSMPFDFDLFLDWRNCIGSWSEHSLYLHNRKTDWYYNDLRWIYSVRYWNAIPRRNPFSSTYQRTTSVFFHLEDRQLSQPRKNSTQILFAKNSQVRYVPSFTSC